MKQIQCIADIEELKARSNLPLPYLKAIESQFLEWFEAEGAGESITSFRLPNESCIYHVEGEEDTDFIFSISGLEFVEKEEAEGWTYFRIGLMNDHQMNLIYILQDTFDQKIEDWLEG